MFMLTTTATAENPVVHDLHLVNGQFDIVIPTVADGDDYAREVAQRVKTRLLMIRGEWYINQNEGTPYRTRVLGKAGVSMGLDQIREMFFAVVYGTPGVRSVGSIQIDIDRQARTLDVEINDVILATGQQINIAELRIPFVVAP